MRLLILFLSLISLKAQSFVWVGESSIAFEDLKFLSGPTIGSYALDPERCVLWNESEGILRKNHQEERGAIDRVLGFVEGKLLTSQGNHLHVRDHEGNLIEELEQVWVATALNVGEGWAFLKSPMDVLSLIQLNSKFEEIKRVDVTDEIWAFPHVRKNAQGIWVGYTDGTQEHSYSPQLKVFDSDLNLLGHTLWPHRGVLTNLCPFEDGSMGILREEPTMPYTLPIYPYLDRMRTPTVKPEVVLEGETNWIIEAALCGRTSWRAERSIHGSDGMRLILPSGEQIPLPSATQALLECDGAFH